MRSTIKFALLFFFLVFIFFLSSKIFTFHLPFWEISELLLRKHVLGSNYQLAPILNMIFVFYLALEKIIIFLDSQLPFFPSFIRLHFWSNNYLYTFSFLPIIFLGTFLLLKKTFKLKWVIILIIFFWVVPVNYLITRQIDDWVIKNNFNFYLPWSEKLVWLEYPGERKSPYANFRYHWDQKNKAGTAKIKISCLGHYQLLVNNQSIYHGPAFAVLPKVYFDQIDIQPFIKSGQNQINIICNFSDRPVHEYAFYPQPALLIGGTIGDGLISHNLADNRLWQIAQMNDFQNGEPISADSGFTEKLDLTQENSYAWIRSSKVSKNSYQPNFRPLPLLRFEEQTLSKLTENVFDLGRFSVGYLKITGVLLQPCQLDISWGAKLDSSGNPITYFNQSDQITFPEGQINWEQFSRRAGRFIKIEKQNCQGEINPKFISVGMPFIEQSQKLSNDLDQKIYQISLDTLKNNFQDHFEDSLEREKAMYLGDTLTMSQCLISGGQNLSLVKEMIKQFADSQNSDGSFPSMTPSGTYQFIPAYTLQWIPLLHLYLTKSHDLEFAKQMHPYLLKQMDWAKTHLSAEGFIYKKAGEQWWLFTDWTASFEDNYQYSTVLQLWYLENLKDISDISKMLGRSENYTKEAERLKQNLKKYAFNPQKGIFSDSFDLTHKSTGSLLVNALAGKLGAFEPEESKKAINFFEGNLYTDSPYSEAWVVEWLIKSGNKELALQVLQNYWGGILQEGFTSWPEVYTLNQKEIVPSVSLSHGWGCAPIYLYPQLLN